MAKKSEAPVGFEPLISGVGETALPTAPQPLTNWLLDDDGDLWRNRICVNYNIGLFPLNFDETKNRK